LANMYRERKTWSSRKFGESKFFFGEDGVFQMKEFRTTLIYNSCLRVDRCQVSWKMAYHHSNPAHICFTSGSSFSSEQSTLWLKVVCKAAFSDSEVCDSLFEDLAHLAVQSIDDLGSQDWGVGTCGSLMVTLWFIFDLDWNSFSSYENTEHQCESPN